MARHLPVNSSERRVEVALAHLLPDLVEDSQTPLASRVRPRALAFVRDNPRTCRRPAPRTRRGRERKRAEREYEGNACETSKLHLSSKGNFISHRPRAQSSAADGSCSAEARAPRRARPRAPRGGSACV